ncbi:hypothetical protein AX16_000839 [Volvariella volvacea WC 439]|nr:hypothetical protein AX16_000839 [Volvariella volvacea WC 439]
MGNQKVGADVGRRRLEGDAAEMGAHSDLKTPVQNYNVAFAGTGGTGKTSLHIVLAEGPDRFPTVYIPLLAESHILDLDVDQSVAGSATSPKSRGKQIPQQIQVTLHDTMGQSDCHGREPFDPPFLPHDIAVFLVCFSFDRMDAYEHILERWIPAIEHYFGHGPTILLLGLKKDIKDDPQTEQQLAKYGETMVRSHQGEKLAKEINAMVYHECSAKTGEGVLELERLIARAIALQTRKKKKSKFSCIIA